MDDLSRLCTDGRILAVDVAVMKELLADEATNLIARNVPKLLSQLHQSLLEVHYMS